MTIALFGTVVSSCDTAGDFSNNNSGANINATDDDFVEGTGAIGDKMSNTTELLVSDALTFTTSTVFDFSSAGATTDEGAHFIGWVNLKTPFDVTDGMAVMFRNAAGHQGTWNVMPSYFYKGGFTTRVINPSKDFDTATTWSLTGNPAQLDDVTEMGFQVHTVSSIMGSFNNVQCDQFTVGFGVRADVGTLGTPNTYQDVIDEDQDTSFWGWHSSIGAKGGLYIGPATGSVASWFVDSPIIKFLDEDVAAGFYQINIRGANTTCDWSLANISAQSPAVARWSLTLDSALGDTTGGFTDASGVWSGADVITLDDSATLTGTTIIDSNSLLLLGGTLDSVTVLEPNVVASAAFIVATTLADISDCTFNQNTGDTGHAIEIDTAGTYTFAGNSFPGYSTTGAGSNLTPSSGATNAMILNSSGGLVTINVSGGGQTPVIRNTAVSTTQVNNNITVTFDGLKENTEVRVYDASSGVELDGIEDATAGSVDNRNFPASVAGSTLVDYVIVSIEYENIRVDDFTWPASDATLPIQQRFDRNYENP